MRFGRILLLFLSLEGSVHALNLDEFLGEVIAKNRLIQSHEKSKEAAFFRRAANDVILAPVLSLYSVGLDDKKIVLLSPGTNMTWNNTWNYGATLAQSFSTGTQMNVNFGATSSVGTLESLTTRVRGFASDSAVLGLSLSQSLWKNAFGRATRWRLDRESSAEKLARETYDLQTKQLLIEAEGVFWEVLYLREELKQRQESSARARKIESWVKARFSNGIGEKSDVLNAEGLTALRDLQLLQTNDAIAAARKKVNDLVEGNESWVQKIEGDLTKERPLEGLVTRLRDPLWTGPSGKKIRLETRLSLLETKMKSLGVEEAKDAMKPDLVLTGGYATNAPDQSRGIGTAVEGVTDTSRPTMNLGLRFIWLLDGDVRNAHQEAARQDLLASQLKTDKQISDSDSIWLELQRKHDELSREILAAKKVAGVQKEKALAERDKLSRGRTVTSQAILAEQDAAESELTLTRLEIAQRKMESQAKMFIYILE